MTTVMPDTGILEEVDFSLEPSCDVENCQRPAGLLVRFGGCGCSVLVCHPCFEHDCRVWDGIEAPLKPGTAVAWWCPICKAEHVAQAPRLWHQIAVLVVPL